MINPDGIRKELEDHLGSVLTDDEWQFLVERRHVDEVVSGDTGIAGLAAEVRIFRKAWRRAPSEREVKQQASVTSDKTRAEAIARMLATDASKQDRVENFRLVHMAAFPLDPNEVDRWIRNVADADGPSTAFLSVKVPHGVEILHSQGTVVTKPPLTISEETPAVLVQKVHLTFMTRSLQTEEYPDIEVEQQIAVREGGTLDALRQVSEHLSRHYGWEEGWATEFVLTDRIPPIRPIESSSSLPSTFTSLARIVLTIDPALSPREVMDKYRAERTQLAGNRHRDLSEKHLQLAAFTSSRPAGESWKDRMNVWNDTYDQWRYERETNFGRDCSQAVRRLLHPAYIGALPSLKAAGG